MLILAALVFCGCGPRTTLDPFDRVCLAPIKVSPRVIAEARTLTAQLGTAYAHYLSNGGLFHIVETGCTDPTGTAVVIEPTILYFESDRARPFAFLGGRARGYAVIRYTIRDSRRELIEVVDIQSIARSGPGSWPDLPPALGGPIDPTAEGAAIELHYWCLRNKSNPRRADVAEPQPP